VKNDPSRLAVKGSKRPQKMRKKVEIEGIFLPKRCVFECFFV